MEESLFILSPILIAFVLAFLYWAIAKENVYMKLFFLISSISFLFIGQSQTVTMALVGNATATYQEVYGVAISGQWLMTIVVILFFMLLFILYLNTLFKKGMEVNKDKYNQVHNEWNW